LGARAIAGSSSLAIFSRAVARVRDRRTRSAQRGPEELAGPDLGRRFASPQAGIQTGDET
jgi:hypothetical protein